jgi:hypothetical protein
MNKSGGSTMSRFTKISLLIIAIIMLLPILVIVAPAIFGIVIIAGLFILKLKYPEIKGAIGERYVNNALSKLGPEYKLLHDLYVPNGKGGTAQVDHVVTSPYGIFVIETKHYNGWIFGDENQKSWTQVIYKRKEKFLNPIWQNYGHIQALKKYIGNENLDAFYSIIAFSTQSTFKFQNQFTSTQVIHIPQLENVIKQRNQRRLSDSELAEVNHILERLLIKDKKQKSDLRKKHVEAIRNKPKEKVMVGIQHNKVCPRCGGELSLKKGKFGSFYGCSNFPKCKHTRQVG